MSMADCVHHPSGLLLSAARSGRAPTGSPTKRMLRAAIRSLLSGQLRCYNESLGCHRLTE